MTNSRRSLTSALALAVLSATVLLLVSFAQAASSVKVVTVKMTDTTVKFSVKSAPAGTVKFAIKNTGKKPHAFGIAGKTSRTIAPRHGSALTVVFKKAGKYTYHVTNGGKKGVLAVSAPSSSGGSGAAQLALGKTVFKANCGSCHILKAAGTVGTAGPDLDKVKRSVAVITHQVTSGGRFMPPFSGQLSSAQIAAVAAFVSASEH
jgi:cytochrome c6